MIKLKRSVKFIFKYLKKKYFRIKQWTIKNMILDTTFQIYVSLFTYIIGISSRHATTNLSFLSFLHVYESLFTYIVGVSSGHAPINLSFPILPHLYTIL